MSEEIRYKYTPEQTAKRREETVAQIARSVGQLFEKHPELRSALMLVAQYWCDEAFDAVHCHFLFSKLATPDFEAAHASLAASYSEGGGDECDSTNLPEGLEHLLLDCDVEGFDWDDDGDAIPLFAAFTREGSEQDTPMTEAGVPYAIFRRSPTGVETEWVGKMLRPWLDGVMPEWEAQRAGK